MADQNNTPSVYVQTAGRISTCRSCGAPIVWIKTASGKSMPCDASPVYFKENEKGKDRVVTLTGATVCCDIITEPPVIGFVGYRPHYSTCNDPGKFRKQERKSKT